MASGNRFSSNAGFTLVELLVVILIIGILAAIAIPLFASQKGNGVDAVAKANAGNLKLALTSCFVQSSDYSQFPVPDGRPAPRRQHPLGCTTRPGRGPLAALRPERRRERRLCLERRPLRHPRDAARSHGLSHLPGP